jgi:membrane protein required for colicin V production
MTALDYFVLIILASSLAVGAVKGIIKGAISITFAVAGVVAAANLYPYGAGLFGWLKSNARLAQMLGFTAIFALVVLIGSAATFALRAALKRVGLSWIDHALGAVFGLLRGWLICSAVYLALTAFPLRPAAVEQARTAPVLLEGTRAIAYLTSNEMRQRFADGYAAVREVWEQRSREAGSAKNREESRK